MNIFPYLGLGVIITLSSKIISNEKIYNITHSNFPSCVCFHYEGMNNTSIGKRGMYINCKYFYYIFYYSCKLDCDSHRPDKVNNYIHHPNIRVRRACIEEALVFVEHGVAHTTSILETDCSSFHWHIARLSADSPKRCWAMQANTRTLCNV